MKKPYAVLLRRLLCHSAAIRYYIILLIAVFTLSGSLFSQEMAKNKAAGNPCVKGNCVNGKGEMKYATGDAYNGAFRKGLANGFGEMTWKSGDRYRGGWKDGKMNGYGEMNWAMGDKYTGSWKDNLMDGNGTMRWKTGDRYDGKWKAGKMHGTGKLQSKNGQVTQAAWNNGTMIVDAPKGGAVPEPAGKYGQYSLLNPGDTQYTENPSMEYNFVKGGTGTWKRMFSESGANGKISWKLDKNVLTIQHLEWEGGPAKYNYDSGKKYFTEEPRPYGPMEKLQVVSILKKQ